MTESGFAETPPTGSSLGRHATLWHSGLGALDRVSGPQKTEGARFYAQNNPTVHGRIIVEYPDDDALAAAWESTLFESPIHADEHVDVGENNG